ncbi:MAG: hypothetical protein WC979_06030 [Candidatus Pacearchaeota archaeon]|jgi:hypothetical protein
MSLEGLIGKEEVKKLTGKPFNIDPRGSYDRKTFVKSAGSLFDLNDDYRKLSENINNMDALKDVIKDVIPYAVGDPGENVALYTENPHLALSQAEALLGSAEFSMAQFVENNRGSLLEKLDAKQLYSLFAQTPSYETGKPEYDKIRDLKDKMQQLGQAQQDGKDVGSVVQKELNDLLKKVTPEQRAYIQNNPHLVIPSLQKAIISKIEGAFGKIFKDEKGAYDKKAIIDYLTANYQAVEDQMSTAYTDDDRNDLWDKNLKPLYLALAKTLQGSEKKAQKMEDNPEKENWKSEVKGKGMRI